MAKTSQLNILTTLEQDDLIQVVDVSDTLTMTGGGGTNKKVTLSTLSTGLITLETLEPIITPGTSGQYYRGDKQWAALNKAAVGLSNVTNESKTTMFNNPVFTGIAGLPTNTSIGDVSSDEIGYLNGVTSSIQAQLDNKQGIVTNVSSDEIGYLNGVTSSIQVQLDNKQGIVNGAASSIINTNLPLNLVLVSNPNGKVGESTITTTQLNYLSNVTGNIQTQIDSLKSSTIQLTAQTLTLSTIHNNAYIQCQHVTSTAITVPNQTDINWPTETVIYFRRDSAAGAISLIAGVGVTIKGQNDAPTIIQNQNFALRRISTNVWDFI
jgi:hypothetical protein